jgi:hypothetical protein
VNRLAAHPTASSVVHQQLATRLVDRDAAALR